jgi:hypothetical protein
MKFVGFRRMFPKEEIGYWATHYPLEWDQPALDAGRNIREGDYSQSNLEIIVQWKSNRRVALIAENSAHEIEDALRLALQAKEPRSAFAVLMGLRGVGTPMASAILTATDQERYTVIDYRALEALGAADQNTDLNFYLYHYFPECNRLASEVGVSLRILDRALWSWSNENQKSAS